MEKDLEDGRLVVGSDVTTQIHCELQDNGYWRVVQTITQKRKIEGEEEWEEKTLSIKADAEKLETAILNAFVSIEGYRTPRGSDLFAEPVYDKPVVELPDKTEDGEYIN